MIRAVEINKGNVIEHKDELWLVLNTRTTSVGKKGAYIQVKMKSLQDQHIETRRFASADQLEKVFLESRRMVYLYRDDIHYVFMDPETGEQTMIAEETLGEAASYLAYNVEVEVDLCKGRPVQLHLPPSVALEVTDTDPAVRGDTATGVTKPAQVETGLTLKVPGHIQQGEKIRVDTRTGEFLGRA